MTTDIDFESKSKIPSESSESLNPAFLCPIQPDEFLPPISRWAIVGGLLLMGTLASAIALAAVTQYNVTVRSPATVRPSGEIRMVEARTEGTVKKIQVKENQVVKEGEMVVSLDSSQLLTQKNKLSGNIRHNQGQLEQIAAQISALNTHLAAQTRAQESTIASAQADLSHKQTDYQKQQTTSQAEVQAAQANLNLAQTEWRKAQEDLQREHSALQASIANLKSVEASLKAAISKQNRYQPLWEAEAISLDLVEETQLAVEQQKQAVAEQKSTVEAQKQAVESQRKTVERQQQGINVAIAQLQRVKAALNPSDAPVAIAQERIAQEKARGEATLATLKKEREALIERRLEIQNQINRDRQELKQLDIELTKTIVRSPVDGIILKLNLRNTGQVVQYGANIAEITPLNAIFVVKARVPAKDIGKIALEQKSLMRISAYPYPDYGVLEGKVSAIAPDAISSQSEVVGTATPYYEVTIQPEKTYFVKSQGVSLSQNDQQYPIQPGMEATVDIISQQETVLTFILRKARLLTKL